MKIHISLTLFVLLLLATIIRAQDDNIPPADALFTFAIQEDPDKGYVGAFIDPVRIEWLPDSRSFRFPFATKQEDLANIYYLPTMQYALDTKELVSSMAGGCLAQLTRELAIASDTGDCIRTLSPNGRYAIYHTQESVCGEICSPELTLADLKTNEHVDLLTPIYTDYSVRWSANSQAFLILAGSPYGGGDIFYAHIPETFAGMTRLDLIHLEAFEYGYPPYVELSHDGEQVLVRGYGDTLYGIRLWKWFPEYPERTQPYAIRDDAERLLEGERISGFQFMPGDPEQILVVLERGIVHYNLETGEEILINPNITANERRWVYFSPDGQYGLLYHDGWHGVREEKRRTFVSLFRVNLDE